MEFTKKYRMNEPSTCGKNWKWMASKDSFTDEIGERLKEITHIYGRA